jgi:hypothetical protein
MSSIVSVLEVKYQTAADSVSMTYMFNYLVFLVTYTSDTVIGLQLLHMNESKHFE